MKIHSVEVFKVCQIVEHFWEVKMHIEWLNFQNHKCFFIGVTSFQMIAFLI